ncbi:LEAF RUST 10 DISEASE-RESISTANCE LOCUS RECEPTOR-LIKE PROTEIN KINASE-like 2.7 [Rhododendron vialii]|uniref:LEAF RUST 10 DISEASE-RESISTANCE LOCUS RECEPTOR-LIKE PROTEIN KINASE-like 2.7 n=1 Tax=Rhododendron vialii TaxID=182163 RepID=UPI00265FCF67|nr:LEAF RUST 10 DISEASE-RESISTANCE LOCUS RECEPTOR-LIKE PROTEIN KINASE-like 2.7 [Rhododendron vialii]
MVTIFFQISSFNTHFLVAISSPLINLGNISTSLVLTLSVSLEMNSHFFLFCCLSFPILISTIVPESSGSRKEQYTSCSQPFQCSNIPNLGYPFWGGNRPASCGHPNFELDCQSQVPEIKINSIPYRVLSIDNPIQTLTVARTEFWNNPCPSPTQLHINATLDTAHLAYSNDSQNMTIYYGCPAFPFPGVTPPNQFSCTTYGTSYFVITGGVEVPDLVTAISGCRSSVVVHVNQAVTQGLMSVPPSITIKEALDSGFRLQWDANDTICNECVRSGGVCGSGSGYAFACLCPDQAYPEACNSPRGGSGMCSTNLILTC